jgi:hypothetical protein
MASPPPAIAAEPVLASGPLPYGSHFGDRPRQRGCSGHGRPLPGGLRAQPGGDG